jgi:Ca2+-binding RTX toxin-like protein
VIVGHDGYAAFTTAGVLTYITTTDQSFGGDDTITTGDGNNVILGGTGAATITVGKGNNIILGKNGDATFLPNAAGTASVLTQIETIAELSAASGSSPSVESGDQSKGGTLYGSDDIITVNGDGNNVILGGLGADTVTLNGNGNNIVLGDSGYAAFDPTTGRLLTVTSTYVLAPVGGTADTGTSSNDVITGRNGNNIVIGGAGNDTITLGTGNNVIFGDNAQAQFVLANGANILSRAASIAAVSGGNDMITAGDGDNAVVGGVGNDAITLGNGNNLVLGDNGEIVQAFDANGMPVYDTARDPSGNLVLHRDIVLETFASITAEIPVDSAANLPTTLAGLTNADMLLLTGAYNADGSQVLTAAGNWQTDALVLSLIRDGNDAVTVGNGSNVVIGQGGNNTITAGNGNNTIFGDGASNTSTLQGDLPTILNSVMIYNATAVPSLIVGANGQLVVPMVALQLYDLTAFAPTLHMGPDGPGTLSGLAEGGTIAQVSGSHLVAFASIVDNLTSGSPGLPGNNTITVGAGNNMIFGTNGAIVPSTNTGIDAIDSALSCVSSALLGLSAELSVLAYAQDAVAHAVGLGSSSLISIGDNTIVAGNGNNIIFGASGEVMVPSATLDLPQGTDYATSVLQFASRLVDLQQAVGDLADSSPCSRRSGNSRRCRRTAHCAFR